MSRKGSLEERKVVKIFEENGYGAIRVPASGAKTKSDKPDVLAGNGTRFYAIEVKSSKNDYIYIRKEQMEELKRFAQKFGAMPLICAKFTRKPYSVLLPDELQQTPSGKYVVRRKEIDSKITLEEMINNGFQDTS